MYVQCAFKVYRNSRKGLYWINQMGYKGIIPGCVTFLLHGVIRGQLNYTLNAEYAKQFNKM